MCGIAGIVDFAGRAEIEAAQRMSTALGHRGPDSEGTFAEDGVAFAFRRLAILDLSPAGNQPMRSGDGRYVLIHNGEIYNYRELRSELEARSHVFTTGTDTEVILAAFAEWGTDCVQRFNGMWAFAIWDSLERRLFASRDRFGVKPFYYVRRGSRLLFASEPGALAEVAAARSPNLAVIRDYVEQGYLDHTEQTFFEGIVRLPAAHSLAFDANGLRLWRYWRLELREPPADVPSLARELLVDSVRLRLRSDVPVGSCLSGGLDSSAIVCVIRQLRELDANETVSVGPRPRTFTAFFEERSFDERPFAQAVVDVTDAEPHWITFDADDLVANLDSIVAAQGEPFGSTSMAAQWYVMRAAREAGMTVMLDGQGGDEVFGGYHGFFAAYFADLVAGGRVHRLLPELAAYRRIHGAGVVRLADLVVRRLVPDRVRWTIRGRARGGSSLLHTELPRGYTRETEESPFPDRLRRLLELILTTRGLPELLRYEDRNSMAHSLEARVPFLDYRLVELMYSAAPEQLLDRGTTKVTLRRALDDLLPPIVRDRSDKLGFVTPEGSFMRGALGKLAEETFASKTMRDRGWIDVSAARERLRRHRRGEIDAGFELWRALNLELWARRFVDAAATGGR